MATYPGEFCKNARIKCADIISLSRNLPKIPLSKGVVLELYELHCNEGYSWNDFYMWLCHLVADRSSLPVLSTVKVKIS